TAEVWPNYERAKQVGRMVGPKNLAAEERQAYFTAVKLMADGALSHNALELAIENYQLYAESERSGLETLRTLADLHERKGDALAALRITEQALVYNPKDKDLLQRKDRYYYSVMPDTLRACSEAVRGGLDLAYCLRKGKRVRGAEHWDLGDRTRAVKFYKHVVSYDSHPLAPDAYDALHRLQAK